jgi:hypothetical protein
MDTREKEFRTDAVEDKSPDITVADNDKNYMFPPAEVGIPLTKLQWALTFIGYDGEISTYALIMFDSYTDRLSLACLYHYFLLQLTRMTSFMIWEILIQRQ